MVVKPVWSLRRGDTLLTLAGNATVVRRLHSSWPSLPAYCVSWLGFMEYN